MLNKLEFQEIALKTSSYGLCLLSEQKNVFSAKMCWPLFANSNTNSWLISVTFLHLQVHFIYLRVQIQKNLIEMAFWESIAIGCF